MEWCFISPPLPTPSPHVPIREKKIESSSLISPSFELPWLRAITGILGFVLFCFCNAGEEWKAKGQL